MKQLIEDSKLIIGTDKRIWAAVGFLVVVLIFWSLTNTWRPLPEVPSEKVVKVEVSPRSNPGSLIEGLHESITSLNQTNDILKKDIDRVSKNLETKQEEIDWNVDQLVSRLSNMSSKLDNITKKVGERNVEKFKVDQRMENRGKKYQQR